MPPGWFIVRKYRGYLHYGYKKLEARNTTSGETTHFQDSELRVLIPNEKARLR